MRIKQQFAGRGVGGLGVVLDLLRAGRGARWAVPMSTIFGVALVFALWGSGAAFAGDAENFAAVRAADEARIAATIAGDATKLSALLSEQLRYAHADGRVQNKIQFLAAARGNTTKYLSVEPSDIGFQAVAPGAVAMNGRAHLVVSVNGNRLAFDLRFLAIWREEAGQWRLLAYQSARLDAPPAK
jgi:hypothetical protein